MITPSFSPTATERVLPKLALDFTTASLDPRVTFTRTTDATHPATYVNSSGYVTAATNNQARFDYDPVALTCKGLLIEESRTNIQPYSQKFNTTAGWAKINVTVNETGTTSPANDNTGNLVTAVAATGGHGIQNAGIAGSYSGIVYTASCYLKKGTSKYMTIGFSSVNAAYWVAATFDVDAGTVTQGTAGAGGTYTASSITNIGNGWYRCTVTGSFSAGSYLYTTVQIASSGTPTIGSYAIESWTAAGTETAYWWGFQIEAGAFATSYIPTTTTALTRNADEASMTGTNFTDWWNSTQNTIEFQYLTNLSGTATGNRYIGCVAKDASNFIEIAGKNTNGKTVVYQNIAGSFDVSMTGATSIFTNTYNKLIVAMQANNYGFALDSTSQGTDTSCSLLSSPTSFEIGRWKEAASVGGYFCGWVQKINAYPQRLTASELSAFTAG